MNDEIKIRSITEDAADLYSPDNEFMGRVTLYQFNDIRIQIKDKQVEGYYFLFKGKKIPVDKNGRFDHWPPGFFDMIANQLAIILDI